MTITAELQSISSQDGDGSIAKGIHREVITFSAVGVNAGAGIGAVNYQLKPDQSGALIVFNSLTGNLVTLPTPVRGMWFEFINQIAATSVETKVITNDITAEFILGSVIQGSATITQSMDVFTADGTSNHVSISMNVHTAATGGAVGNHFIMTAISATQWYIKGMLQVSGGDATDPFAAS